MIIDACAFVGPRPFARTRNKTVADLLRLMDKAGIDQAVVTPLQGAFYQNAHSANEEILPELRAHADRLTLVAAMNPSYPGWERDLQAARWDLSARGVRLFPNYHAYSLDTAEVHALSEECAALGMPVFISIRLWDERHHPAAFRVPAVPVSDVIALAQSHPDTKFVLSMARFGEALTALTQTAATRNLYADIAGVQGPTRCMARLIKDADPSRLLFASEVCLQYPLSAVWKVQYSGLSEEDKVRIYSGNIGDLLEPDGHMS